MTRSLLKASLVLVLLSSAAFGATEAPADSLWMRGVSLREANSNWVPGSIYMHMQEVDKHGVPKEERGREIWSRLYLGSDGEVESEILKALDKGEDITEKEKAEEAKDREEREREERERAEGGGEGDSDDDSDRMTLRGYTPFDREHQDRIVVKRDGEEDLSGGRRCAVFDFEETRAAEDGDGDKEETVTGKAWIDVLTGVPLKLTYTTDPLPKHVKKMETTVLYDYKSPDEWYAKSMELRATGGLLFIKKHFRMAMDFSDYWRMPEEQPDSTGQEPDGVQPQ